MFRREGQDSQRAFAGARWDLRRLTNWGQEVLLTGYARGDVYHSDENELTTAAIYRGEKGWRGRGIAAAAAEVRWPLTGEFLGGVQRLTPRAQLVVTPPTANISLPNEDSRSVDLEDSNLFALNRFPGYDRWEDGSRITYGLDWTLDRPGWAVTSNIGQSYRLNRDAQIFPNGTGLTDRWSDFVGRTRVKVGRFVDLTHRFRLDKDNFAVRRNEVDLTVGTTETYARIDYLRLNRNVDQSIEDLAATRKSCASPGAGNSTASGRSSARPCSTSPTRTRTRSASPTASTPCATASASIMRTIACRSGSAGVAIMSGSATGPRAAPSVSACP